MTNTARGAWGAERMRPFSGVPSIRSTRVDVQGARIVAKDGDRIEAVLITRATVPRLPGARDALDLVALARVHREQRVAPSEARPRLHLHERDRARAPCDQVDFLVTEAPVASDDAPPCPLQMRGSERLAFDAQVM